MDEQTQWQVVQGRDAAYDGRFVYAVRSTGIYCRPSCPSRRPGRDQVLFFDAPADAEASGYRACRRCRPTGAPSDLDRRWVAQVCRYLDDHPDRVPSLQELSERFGFSPYHLQRTFKQIVGVTPRQYAAERRLTRFKAALKEGETVTEAIYTAGFGSSSAAYGAAPEALGMSPGDYRGGAPAVAVRYAAVPCRLGWLLVAATPRGLCAVHLGDAPELLLDTLRAEFPAAALEADEETLKPWLEALVRYLDGRAASLDLPLDVRSTAFQRQVWDALRAIPYGSTRSYHQVAAAIGRPDAVRAVAGACAHNPVALVIPCHRVVRSDGSLGGYRWGLDRKHKLLEQEALHATSAAVREA